MAFYSLSIFRAYLPYINYWINYDYISTQLCENKDKPDMHCNGKCCLEKELREVAAEENTEKNSPPPQKIIIFQEMPSAAVKINFDLFTVLKSKFKKTSTAYSSPVIEITSPPPDRA